MAKKPDIFALEVRALMQKECKPVLTMLWPEFYKIADIKRFTDPYSEKIHKACLALGIVVGHGHNVVTFCHDANFSA